MEDFIKVTLNILLAQILINDEAFLASRCKKRVYGERFSYLLAHTKGWRLSEDERN